MVAFQAARKRVPGACARLAVGLLLAMSCDDTSSSVEPPPPTLPTGSDDSPAAEVASCSAVENYGPEGPFRRAMCHLQGEDQAGWTVGDPTPAGPYYCECNDSGTAVPDASDCDDALRRGCNVDFASLPPNPCSEPSEVEHVCWPVRGNPNEWSCRCAAWEPLGVVSSSSCGEAVTRYCGRCTSERGSCSRDRVPRQVNEYPQFDCSCGSGETGEADSGSFDAASVDAGSLDSGRSGNLQHVGFEAFGDCSVALVLSCGYPAAGERCEAPNPAGGAFACSADGEGNWSCDCPRYDQCWARRHPVDTCDWGDRTCVHITHPPPELDRPRVCEQAIYEYCQCPED
jgi:hypothetical protein